ncbi:aldo/keto reductase [Candidatus Woesearchaeota archaeon]|nr:aldo/keto reductase [Candidatus Woesearchaeota archaeon]
MSRLILGTVQFGLDYGINNLSGKIPEPIVQSIVDTALEQGVTKFDTAPVYGSSEEVLGRSLHSRQVQLISKLPPNASVKEKIIRTLKTTGQDRLYGFLVHEYKGFDRMDELLVCKAEGLVQKIGFSLYYPEELIELKQKKVPVDIVQIPCNIFDQRFLPYIRESGLEVHVRSVFLQGLLFRSPQKLHPHFTGLKKHMEQLNNISAETGISIAALSMAFVLAQDGVDYMVIGVDSLDNLMQNLKDADTELDDRTLNHLRALKVHDENLILPTKWPKKS